MWFNPFEELRRRAEELGMDLTPPVHPLFGVVVYEEGQSRNWTPEEWEAFYRAIEESRDR